MLRPPKNSFDIETSLFPISWVGEAQTVNSWIYPTLTQHPSTPSSPPALPSKPLLPLFEAFTFSQPSNAAPAFYAAQCKQPRILCTPTLKQVFCWNGDNVQSSSQSKTAFMRDRAELFLSWVGFSVGVPLLLHCNDNIQVSTITLAMVMINWGFQKIF